MTVLLFVATIVTFLGIDYLVRRRKGEAPLGASARTRQTARVTSSMRFPEGVFFSKTHTWLNLSPSGNVRLGVDDFLSRMFAAPELTLLKGEGEQITKGEPIVRMKEGEKSLTVHSPIDGRITRRNAHFNQTAGSSEDLFSKGWAYTVEPKGGASDLRELLLGVETKRWIKGELAKLRDFMASSTQKAEYASVYLQDGGEPMPGVLSGLSAEDCARFEAQFLSNE